MTLTQIQYVLAVAETGTISAAAKRLFIAQPSLTASIKELENELQVTLFRRTNKGVTLTPEGEEFLGYARQVNSQLDLMRERYFGGAPVRRRFCVSTQHYSFAVEAFVALLKEHGGETYDFHLRETQTYEIIEDVALLKSEVGVLYLNPFNETVLKKTIKAHGLGFYLPMNAETTNKIYPNREELLEDVAKIYRAFIKQLYDAGCRNLQLDDCSWGVCVDPAAPFVFGVEPEKMDDIMDQLLKVNNLALEGKPDDLTVATHICRGNYNSSWASRGGYEPVAERLFAHENVDAYYLEFDDARSGGFEPLRFVTPGKKVVLGLITSKRPELEDKDAVIARIHEAAKYVPLENLCLSPQCGFASCEVGNKLTEEQQWAKLTLVKEIVEEVWGK